MALRLCRGRRRAGDGRRVPARARHRLALPRRCAGHIKGKAKKALNDQYFFPTQVRVAGSMIRFFVPSSFLGGVADPSWHYVVAVTGASIEEKIDLSGLIGKDEDTEPPLLNLVIASGPPTDGFGTTRKERDALQTPIVDIIVPEGQKQSEILRNYDLTTARPVEIPGLVPKH